MMHGQTQIKLLLLLVTLLSIFLLGNLRLNRSVDKIRLSQWKEIHPKP